MTTILRRKGLGFESCNLLAVDIGAKVETLNTGQTAKADDMYIRWGTTNSVSNPDAKVINASHAIHRVAHKRGFRMTCSIFNLAPKSWTCYSDAIGNTDAPVVVRTSTHSKGSGLWKFDNVLDAIETCDEIGENRYYISEYIAKLQEFRVHVVQGRVIGVSEKMPVDRTAVAWNFHSDDDGTFANYKWHDWPMPVVRVALAAHKLSRLHFGAVDVMVDAMGRAYVLEVNSAPSLSPYRARCYSRAFGPIMRGKDKWNEFAHDDPLAIVDWKEACHPSLREDN